MTLSLARRADRFPDRTAVVDISEERLYAPAETVHEDRVSYAELAAIAGRAADRLAAIGIDTGDTVSFVSRNRVASLALLFACRRLGATYAPISHRLTPATVDRPFDELDPDLVVSEAAQRDLVRSIPSDRSVTLAELTDCDAEVGGADTVDDEGDATNSTTDGDDTPLFALHGDSGRPIVQFSASAVEWNCITAAITWGLSADDSAVVTPPLSTADGLFRVTLPMLYVGGTVLLDRAFDPGDTLTAIADHGVTTLAGRSTAIDALAAEENRAAVDALDGVLCDASTEPQSLEPYAHRGVASARTYGRLDCPVALSQSFDRGTDAGVGRPVPDCRARLVDDGTVVAGAGTGQLQLWGPVVATVAGTDDAADREQPENGWLETGERFRRGEDGTYQPQ